MWRKKRRITLTEVFGGVACVFLGLMLLAVSQMFCQVLRIEEPKDEAVLLQSESAADPLDAGQSEAAASGVGTSATKPAAFCVVIDPGHGGADSPGTVSGGVEEAGVNLEIAKQLKKLLENQGIHVVMTRTQDTFVGLYERTALANELEADVFISIHQNSIADRETHGMETWYCPDETGTGQRLAELVQGHVTAKTGAKDRGLRTSDELVVVRETKMAACLLECGFLSHDDERAQLTDPIYQARVAEGIASGILAYLAN